MNEMEASLVSGSFDPRDDERENILRPRLLAEFLGQASVKQNLAIFIEAARQIGRASCRERV